MQFGARTSDMTLVHKITDVSTTYDLIKILFKSFQYKGIITIPYHQILKLISQVPF